MYITDLEKLAAYGFRKQEAVNCHGREIWVLDTNEDDVAEISLIVNPLDFKREKDGEIVWNLSVSIDAERAAECAEGFGYFGREYDLPLDIIYDMIADGVIRKAEKAVRAA